MDYRENGCSYVNQCCLSGYNYNMWVQSMKSFLIGRKLWEIVTGNIVAPVHPAYIEGNVDPDPKAIEAHIEKLEEWDSKNHQIIT